MGTGIERRRHRRFDLSLPVRVLAGADTPKEGWTTDISMGGLCFTLDEKCEVGSTVECEIRLVVDPSSSRSVRLYGSGKVARVGEADSTGTVAIGAEIEYYEFLKGSSLQHGLYRNRREGAYSPYGESELRVA